MPGGLGGGSFGGWGGYGNGGFIADGGYAGSASSSGGVQWAVLGPAAPLGSGGVSTSGTQMAVIGDGTPPTASSSSGGYVNVPGGSNGLTPEMEAEIRDFVASAPSGMRLVEGTPPRGAPSAPGGVQSFSLGPPGSPRRPLAEAGSPSVPVRLALRLLRPVETGSRSAPAPLGRRLLPLAETGCRSVQVRLAHRRPPRHQAPGWRPLSPPATAA